MTIIVHPGFSKRLDKEVVFLRRYTRALTGSRSLGDNIANDVRGSFEKGPTLSDVRLSLFKKFHARWPEYLKVTENRELPSLSREVFLLHNLEDFAFSEIGQILELSEIVVERLHFEAVSDLQKMRPSKILLIEDETLIAMDMSNVVSDLGHTVLGVARTRSEAVSLAKQRKPDLITCDINLADGSSGIDAIDDILKFSPTTSVVFLTGFPEKLLTGTRSEPAFVIDKPYRKKQVISVIAQALELQKN